MDGFGRRENGAFTDTSFPIRALIALFVVLTFYYILFNECSSSDMMKQEMNKVIVPQTANLNSPPTFLGS